MSNELVLSTSSNRFELSNEGWRRMNAGRGPKHLVREAISNALDQADANVINVKLERTDTGVRVQVEDNSPTGVQSPEHVTTVFMTSKEDSPTSRGRKGRGVKELIAAARVASIETIGFTVQFEEGRTVVRNNRKKGTRLTAEVDGWTERDIIDIEQHLNGFIVEHGKALVVSGKRVRSRKPNMTTRAHLETVVIKDGVQTTEYRTADVELYYTKPNETAFLYEMGVPVTNIDTPFHINVEQRIPLSDDRTSVSGYYTRCLLALCLEEAVNTWSKKDLKDKWVEEALIYASHSCRKKYVEVMFGDVSKAAVKSTNRDANASLSANGYTVIDTDNMARSVVDAVKSVVSDAETIAKEVERSDAGEEIEWHNADPNAQITAFLTFAVNRLAGFEPRVEFRKYKPTLVFKRDHISILDGGVVVLNSAAFDGVAPTSSTFLRALIQALVAYKVCKGDKTNATDLTLEIAAEVAHMMHEDHDAIMACI